MYRKSSQADEKTMCMCRMIPPQKMVLTDIHLSTRLLVPTALLNAAQSPNPLTKVFSLPPFSILLSMDYWRFQEHFGWQCQVQDTWIILENLVNSVFLAYEGIVQEFIGYGRQNCDQIQIIVVSSVVCGAHSEMNANSVPITRGYKL